MPCGGKTRSATCSAPRLPRTGWCCGSQRHWPNAPTPRSPGVEFKPFQERVLSQLTAYLAELQPAAKTADAQAQVLEAMEEAPDTELLRRLKDYPATGLEEAA